MPSKRQILGRLSAKELRAFIDYYEIDVADRRSKATLVNGLIHSGKINIEDMLLVQPLKTLKRICRELGIGDASSDKELLVRWLLGKVRKKSMPKASRRPKASKRPPELRGKTVSEIPKLKAEWHRKKNKGLKPNLVLAGSTKRVWWRCSRNKKHVWQAQIKSRALGNGCPYCSGLRVTEQTSLARLRPDLVAEWHPTKNAGLTPYDLSPGSNKEVWWRCSENPKHEWKEMVERRIRGNQCPICSGRIPTGKGTLQDLFPTIASEWHPTKNEGLTPDDVEPGSYEIVWWQCKKDPRHEWQKAVRKRLHDRGCPICRLKSRKQFLKKTFQDSHPLAAAEWLFEKNMGLTPDEVAPRSMRKVWWRCSKNSEHEWQASPASRSRGTGCPYCAGKIASKENSLAAFRPDLVAEWHPEKNGDLTPDNVTHASSRKVWWRCSKNPEHEWIATVGSRTGKNSTGCPFCSGRRKEVSRED